MNEKIAVLVNESGLTASFFEKVQVHLYEKSKGQWEVVSTFPLKLNMYRGIGEVRNNLLEVINNLSGCKVIVGRDISGQPYNILNSNGFAIVQLEGEPLPSLEYIWNMVTNEALPDDSAPTEDEVQLQPIETSMSGNYTIDLIKIQSVNHTISSKKLLLPFLNNTTFNELEVICSHVPPWFETELEKLGMNFDIQTFGADKFKVIIFKKACTA